MKIVKFLVEKELFPPNQSDGKQLVGSWLVDPPRNRGPTVYKIQTARDNSAVRIKGSFILKSYHRYGVKY